MGIKNLNDKEKYIFMLYGKHPLPLRWAASLHLIFNFLNLLIVYFSDLSISKQEKYWLILFVFIFQCLSILFAYGVTQWLVAKGKLVPLMYLHSTFFGLSIHIAYLFIFVFILIHFRHPELYEKLFFYFLIILGLALFNVTRFDDEKLLQDSISIYSGKSKKGGTVVSIANLFGMPIIKYFTRFLFLVILSTGYKSLLYKHDELGLYYLLLFVSTGIIFHAYAEIFFVLIILKIEFKRLFKFLIGEK